MWLGFPLKSTVLLNSDNKQIGLDKLYEWVKI